MRSDGYDVVVVGGGAAGLSGALTLARAGRSVLVVDDGRPRNAPAGHVHNYLGREGIPPAELYAIGRAEVAGYGGEVADGRVTGARREHDGFVVTVDGDREVRARRLLLTTGLVDELPDLPGISAQWGRGVLHCPYCHGAEVRDRPIGILGTTPFAVHHALLWRQWSADVVLFRHTSPEPTQAEREQLAARGIPVVEQPVAGLETDGDRLTGVRLADGAVVPREAVVVSPRFTARADVLDALGLRAEEQLRDGVPFGNAVPAGPTGATAVPGVWVAGNVTDPMAQVVVAAGTGLMAAAHINGDLIEEDTRRAVDVHRHATEVHDRAWWEERYRSAPGLWSGRANDVLVTEVADLPPGRALDAGAGEGGDALWLAGRGWRVTALDLSEVALERGARAAAEQGLGDRVEWRQLDLTEETPEPGGYDLVTSSFLHPPADVREKVLRGLADAVAPGGTLLVVNHDPSELANGLPRHARPEDFASAEEVAGLLDPAEWELQVVERRPRGARGHEGDVHEVADAVVRARRLVRSGAAPGRRERR
ncbi:MAG TPA: FAD-dependent oxidoreductase [Blastococcus sp.]|nr:FAD-dependent oxidoreductase [Blastococcus sp.]